MKISNVRLTVLMGILLLISSVSFAGKPIKTLLITGQNNHNWQASHIVLKQILENSGLFTVDFAITPKEGDDMSSFILDFTPYQLVVLDYVGDSWPQQTRERFLQFLEKGGGVVVYHAANNAFPDWDEYNKMIALGGWLGRNQKAGPWVYWENGKLVKDFSPGVGGSHGNQHEYVLTARNTKHPIVRGLPPQWKHATDELYDRMRGPGNIKDLLYTAFSDKGTNGSGREEPLIFTVAYRNGRIFHTMLGHMGKDAENNPSMQCTGFQVTLLRGSEWAATGRVTQPVPKDFPTATTISMRKNYKE